MPMASSITVMMMKKRETFLFNVEFHLNSLVQSLNYLFERGIFENKV